MPLYVDENDGLVTGKAKQLGSLGETKVDEITNSFTYSGKKIDDNYTGHKISIKKEYDRLVVKGQFKRGQNINVILRRGLENRSYNIRVSKKPYTALCVDIFTEEETANGIEVTKYINQDGLKGRYNVYIEIDGTVYNTGEYVKF